MKEGCIMFICALDEFTQLRPLYSEHAKPLFELIERSRNELEHWLGWVKKTTTVEHTMAFISSTLQQTAENKGFSAGIWTHNELAGVISYRNLNWTHRTVGLGYWLGAEYRGQGLMTSACRLFVDYALIQLDLNRVQICTSTNNKRSRAIPERLGFVLEGVIRQSEKLESGYTNQAVYGMLQHEWELLR